jgi:hypothetical protein
VSADFSERERQILSSIEGDLGSDLRLERYLRTGHIGGLRWVWDSVWATAVLTALLVAGAVAAVAGASTGNRIALILPAILAGAVAVYCAVHALELHRTRRHG